MEINHPAPDQLGGLRRLWAEAFEDTPEYLDSFYSIAFSPERCRCISVDSEVAAVLYWFDMECSGLPIAYIYAVATGQKHRGKGLCRALMTDTHALLAQRGYAGAILVPEDEGLSAMYGKMGYRPCCGISEIHCAPGDSAAEPRRTDPESYNRLRNTLLPPGGVRLGDPALAFLAAHAEFFTGDSFALAAVRREGKLYGMEYLGDTAAIPGILRALDCSRGTFRIPGKERPFAMFLPLNENVAAPTHFGFAFD